MDQQQRCGVVSDWMTRRPTAVQEECSIGAALGRMRSAEVRHLLVLDGDRLSGIVSNRDLRRLALEDSRSPLLSEPVKRIMTEDPITAAPETAVTAATRLLLEQRIGALPIREGEEIVGIFTISDALEALLAMVERPGA